MLSCSIIQLKTFPISVTTVRISVILLHQTALTEIQTFSKQVCNNLGTKVGFTAKCIAKPTEEIVRSVVSR